MKKTFLNILFFAGIITFSYPQDIWTQKASVYNYGRRSSMGCSVNGKGYFGLGQIYDGSFVKDIWVYDTTTNRWNFETNYPGSGSHGVTSFSLNNKLYICLGFSTDHICQSDLWEYDPETKIWIEKASFPGIPRYGACSFTIDSFAYIACGSHNVGNDYLYDLWQYNSAEDSWTEKSSFTGGPRAFATAFSIGGFGYLGLGSSSSMFTRNDFWKYDPVNDLWTAIANFPGPSRDGALSFVIHNIAYVGTGYDYSQYFNTFWKYNPINSSWGTITNSDQAPERGGGNGFSIGEIGFMTGGMNETGILTDLWSFRSSDSIILFKNVKLTNQIFLKIYPNPSNQILTIEVPFAECYGYLMVSNSLGEEILTIKISNNKSKIDIGNLSAGIYIIKYVSGSDFYVSKLYIVN
jgi:N-acetylneuraminic acid mutarotase